MTDAGVPGNEVRQKTVIMGAAGRDFHNFNVLHRDNAATEVVAFTAAQIPGIEGRRYPPELAGPLYPKGIPIRDEIELEKICRDVGVDCVEFAYSDVPHATVMHAASRVLAAGANFSIVGPRKTMLAARRKVIAVTATRTGCGKSQVCRHIAEHLRGIGLRVAALRHPMPYGDLARQRVQRFADGADLDRHHCTNEEREEYEPYIEMGSVVFAGVDYIEILRTAEAEADIILWDGGNNDFSFIQPDLNIVLVDALRPGQTAAYHPGETTLRLADVVVISKVDAAPAQQVEDVEREVRSINSNARLLHGASPATLDDPEAVRGRRVLVIDDGPILTHGGMAYGAGYVAANAGGAAEIIDPRETAAPLIKDVFAKFPHLERVLPAVGYSKAQCEALRKTIDDSDADLVVVGTPFDLAAHLGISKPSVRVRYEYADAGSSRLTEIVDELVDV